MVMLKTVDLGISFGGLNAVNSFNIEVEEGQLYGLIGPNGAGKTTVFNLLTGVYKPTTGRFSLAGEDLTGKSPTEICNHGIARTFQNIRLFKNMSVIDNVKVALHTRMKYPLASSFFRFPNYFSTEKRMNDEALRLLEVFDLDKHKDYNAASLPYGKQRKLEIARAMATNPKLLLLDEPAAGMNPNETAELMETIRFVRGEFNMTILLIEHDMRLVAGICEKLTVLNFGTELASGETTEVLKDPQVITAYLGE
ncbi:MAG: ABC transporter ATP-binding protein [Clostridiales bacterium]|jgi:branched-chain amino acid transport system ATP-binding protein|nr:ABC transporter ATP-binding protein [Clostridiales bacterium]